MKIPHLCPPGLFPILGQVVVVSYQQTIINYAITF